MQGIVPHAACPAPHVGTWCSPCESSLVMRTSHIVRPIIVRMRLYRARMPAGSPLPTASLRALSLPLVDIRRTAFFCHALSQLQHRRCEQIAQFDEMPVAGALRPSPRPAGAIAPTSLLLHLVRRAVPTALLARLPRLAIGRTHRQCADGGQTRRAKSGRRRLQRVARARRLFWHFRVRPRARPRAHPRAAPRAPSSQPPRPDALMSRAR